MSIIYGTKGARFASFKLSGWPSALPEKHLALAAVAHAQRAVDERFDLDGAIRADFADLPARKLAREHRARHAETSRFFDARERVQTHLRRGVQRHVGNDFLQRR